MRMFVDPVFESRPSLQPLPLLLDVHKRRTGDSLVCTNRGKEGCLLTTAKSGQAWSTRGERTTTTERPVEVPNGPSRGAIITLRSGTEAWLRATVCAVHNRKRRPVGPGQYEDLPPCGSLPRMRRAR